MRKLLIGVVCASSIAGPIKTAVCEERLEKVFEPNQRFLSETIFDRNILYCTSQYTRDASSSARRCLNRRQAPDHIAPPAILPLDSAAQLKQLEITATNDVLGKLTGFVCNAVWKLYDDRQTAHGCSGEVELKPLLFAEFIPSKTSSFPMLTMKLYGQSTNLAARKQDYWELHRLSFQLIATAPETREILVASIFDSRMQKNRDNARRIPFDELMNPIYNQDVAEFLDRIIAALK
jgi:hypothetical protein